MNTNKFVVVIAFFVAASLGFAQGMRGTGGGGMAGQPIDGTAISPSSVTTTGDITANGDLTVGADGGDSLICLNGPTCTTNLQYTQGTSNFAIFHNNASQISSNNVSLIQIWRDVQAQARITSAVASGSDAYRCTNVGCRLSLGNTGRYLYDTGSTLASIGSFTAESVNAGVASPLGRLHVLSETTSYGPNAFDSQHAVFGRSGNSGAVFATYHTGDLEGFLGALSPGSSWRPLRFGGSSWKFGYQGANVVASIDSTGNVSGNGFVATTASGSALTGGGASGPLLLTSNTPDSHTSSTIPAIKLQASQNITDTDLLVSVEDSAGNRRLTLTEAGNNLVLPDTFGTFTSGSSGSFKNPSNTAQVVGARSSDANSIGVILRNSVDLTVEGARIATFRNATTDVASFSKDGLLRVNENNRAKPTCNADNRGRIYYVDGATGVPDTYEVCSKNAADAYAWVQVGFSSENASAPMTLTSNAPDSVTSTTVPAIRLQASQNITDSDLLMTVEDSAGNRRAAISELGNATFSGNVIAGSGMITNFFNQSGYGSRGNNAITIPDDGAGTPAAYTWQPQFAASVTYFTCNDADGCEITMSLGSSFGGVYNRAFNIGTNTVTFKDTAGLSEMAGDFAMGQWDTIEFMVVSGRFVELNRSNN